MNPFARRKKLNHARHIKRRSNLGNVAATLINAHSFSILHTRALLSNPNILTRLPRRAFFVFSAQRITLLAEELFCEAELGKTTSVMLNAEAISGMW